MTTNLPPAERREGKEEHVEVERDVSYDSWSRRPSRELITVGMTPATAIGILTIESAFSLSMAMMNAVHDQKSQWSVDRSITIAGANLLLGNQVLDEAVDVLLGRGRRTEPSG